jgi:hypothetical protein
MHLPLVRRPGRSDNDLPVLALLVVVLLLLLAGGGGFMFVYMRRAQAARMDAMQAELQAQEELEQARAREAEANRRKEQAVDDLLRANRPHPATPALERGLARCREGEINEGLLWFARGLEESGDNPAMQAVFRANMAGWGGVAQDERKLADHKGAVVALAVSPDGQAVLAGGDDRAARAWRIDNGQPAGEVPPGEGKVSAVGFGAGGKEWFVANEGRCRRVDAKMNQPVGEPIDPPGTVLAMTAGADGSVMMLGTCEQGIWLAENGGKEGARRFAAAPSPVLSAALGPDAKLVLTGHDDRLTRVWGADGKQLGDPLRHEAPVRAVAVSADGSRFATAAGKTAQVWDAATHQPVGRPRSHEADVLAVAFAPDGKGLLTGDRAGAVRVWPVPAPLAGDPRRLKLWVEVMARKQLDGAGTARPLDEQALGIRHKQLQELGGPLTP